MSRPSNDIRYFVTYVAQTLSGFCYAVWDSVQTSLLSSLADLAPWTTKNLVVIAQTDGMDAHALAYTMNSNTITYVYKDNVQWDRDQFQADIDAVLVSEGVQAVGHVAWIREQLPLTPDTSTCFGVHVAQNDLSALECPIRYLVSK